ncbi:hypothetical protein BJ085DRAFT_36381, partial [Dimargaris cristalligena]
MAHDFSDFNFVDSISPPQPQAASPPPIQLPHPPAPQRRVQPYLPPPQYLRPPESGGYSPRSEEIGTTTTAIAPVPKRRSILPEQVLPHQALHALKQTPNSRLNQQHPLTNIANDELPDWLEPPPKGKQPRPLRPAQVQSSTRWDGHHPLASAVSVASQADDGGSNIGNPRGGGGGRPPPGPGRTATATSFTGSMASIRQIAASRSRLRLPKPPALKVIHPAVHHHSAAVEAVQAPVLRVFIGPLTPDWMTFSLKRRWRAYAPRDSTGTGPSPPPALSGPAGGDAPPQSHTRTIDHVGSMSIPLIREPTMALPADPDPLSSAGEGDEVFVGSPRSLLDDTPRLQSQRSNVTFRMRQSHAPRHSRSTISQYHTPMTMVTSTTTTSRAESFHTAADNMSVATTESLVYSPGRPLPDPYPSDPYAPHSRLHDPPRSPADRKSLRSQNSGHLARSPPGHGAPNPWFDHCQDEAATSLQSPSHPLDPDGGELVPNPDHQLADIQARVESSLLQNTHATIVLSRVAPVAMRRDYCRPEIAMMHYNEYSAPKCRIISDKWKHTTCMIQPGEINFYRRSTTKPALTIHLSSRTRLSLFSSLDNSLAITYFEQDSEQKSRHQYRRSLRHYYRSHQAKSISHRRVGTQRSLDLNVGRYNQEPHAANASGDTSQRTPTLPSSVGAFTPFNLSGIIHSANRVRPKRSRSHHHHRHASKKNITTAAAMSTSAAAASAAQSNKPVQAVIIRFPTAAEAKIWYRILHCHILHVTPIPRTIDLTCPTLSASPFRSVKVEIPLQALPVAASPTQGGSLSPEHPNLPFAAQFEITGPRSVWDVRTMAAFELIVESEWAGELARWIENRSLAVCMKRFDRIDWCVSNLTDGWDALDHKLVMEGYRIAQMMSEDDSDAMSEEDNAAAARERALRDRNTRLNMISSYKGAVPPTPGPGHYAATPDRLLLLSEDSKASPSYTFDASGGRDDGLGDDSPRSPTFRRPPAHTPYIAKPGRPRPNRRGNETKPTVGTSTGGVHGNFYGHPTENESSYFSGVGLREAHLGGTSSPQQRQPYPPSPLKSVYPGTGPSQQHQPSYATSVDDHPLSQSAPVDRVRRLKARPSFPALSNADTDDDDEDDVHRRLSFDTKSSGPRSQRLADLRDILASRPDLTDHNIVAHLPSVHTPYVGRSPTQPFGAAPIDPTRGEGPSVNMPATPFSENVADHPILSTHFIEQTHEMQLREHCHYPDAVVLPNAHEMPEPNPLEGYLLRRPKPHSYIGRYRQMFVMTFDHHLVCVSSYRAKQYVESALHTPVESPPPDQRDNDSIRNPSIISSHVSQPPSRRAQREPTRDFTAHHHSASASASGHHHHPNIRQVKQKLGSKHAGATKEQVMVQRNNPYANDNTVDSADFVIPTSMRTRQQRARSRAPSAHPRLRTLSRLFGASKENLGDLAPGPLLQPASSASPGHLGYAATTSGGASLSQIPYQYHYSTHARLGTMLRHAGGFFDLTQIRFIYPVSSSGVSYLSDAASLMNMPLADSHSEFATAGHLGRGGAGAQPNPYGSYASSHFPHHHHRPSKGVLARFGESLMFWRSKADEDHYTSHPHHAAPPPGGGGGPSLYRHEVYQVVNDGQGREREERVADAALRKETRFDIVMNNGAVLRLQAPTNATMREWIRRLLDLRTYWICRLQADARHRSEAAR